MKKLLQLHHHKHTGKLLHHQHTSYPALILLLALSVGLLSLIERSARVEGLVIGAKLSVTIPTEAAVITSPVDGLSFTSATLKVDGTCQVITPGVIIVIFNNSQSVGSSPCDENGLFSVKIALPYGNNSLVARTVNLTDDYGPDSVAVNIFRPMPETANPQPPKYTAPQPNTSAPSVTQQPTTPTTVDSVAPLTITTSSQYLVHGSGGEVVWRISFQGGLEPYSLDLNWGDGTIERIERISSGEHEFRHTYKVMKNYMAELRLTDYAGRETMYQLAIVSPSIPTVAATAKPNTPYFNQERLTLIGLYITGTILIVTAVLHYGLGIGTKSGQPVVIKRRKKHHPHQPVGQH